MKQYLKLLLAREGKEVLGKRCSNLWLLTLVLVATFGSIAFSEGSMIYLQDRMEDPFTNWVSIENSDDSERLTAFLDSLNEADNMERYGYCRVQRDQYSNYTMIGNDENHSHFLSCRSFDQIRTPLMRAILSPSNLVSGCVVDTAQLVDNTMGFVITIETAKMLGYDEQHLPTYIQFLAPNEGCDSLGLKLVQKQFHPVPMPVLGVVRRLPNNVSMMSSNNFFYTQISNREAYPFLFKEHEEYLHSLMYYVSDSIGVEQFEKTVRAQVPDSLGESFQLMDVNSTLSDMKPWRPGKMLAVYLDDNMNVPRQVIQGIADKIDAQFNPDHVRRVFRYVDAEEVTGIGSCLSVEFTKLDHIRDFELYAKANGIQIDMAQVASKENFHAVTIMAHILSAAMVIFSIVCIIMFLVNMLQSYFQKVKRNIGTFKAFGMNTNELTKVYVVILISIVLVAVVLSLLITWAIQCMLPLIGIEQQGFNYLSLWNNVTYTTTAIIFASTVVTVCAVMANMLKRTPGDLIYDRN